MSLTAFNRLRRMKQEEAMKAENIQKAEETKIEAPVQEVVEEKVEAPVEEAVEETKTSARRGKRNAN